MSRFPSAAAAALAISAALTTSALAGRLGIGREASPEEIAAWDIDVRPDGKGLPKGRGTVAQGEELFQERCAGCHGEFGEGKDRWPALAGGAGSLKADRPDKTVGSFWPYATTLFDYIRRAMPFGNAQSLSPDEVYALTAYILLLNDVTKDQSFALDEKTLPSVKMPNAAAFFDDDRERAENAFWHKQLCMKDCKKAVEVLGRARVLDVTPESKTAPRVD
ncbi:MAG TPA: cytochrome c [Hyphomicrobiaceae bacterium]|jgi:cytochrome c|nr:cytochrome c [Hyphomicrobiaceae bacterium]